MKCQRGKLCSGWLVLHLWYLRNASIPTDLKYIPDLKKWSKLTDDAHQQGVVAVAQYALDGVRQAGNEVPREVPQRPDPLHGTESWGRWWACARRASPRSPAGKSGSEIRSNARSRETRPSGRASCVNWHRKPVQLGQAAESCPPGDAW